MSKQLVKKKVFFLSSFFFKGNTKITKYRTYTKTTEDKNKKGSRLQKRCGGLKGDTHTRWYTKKKRDEIRELRETEKQKMGVVVVFFFKQEETKT